MTASHEWGGGLLAPSATGGIWAGWDRLVDLAPEHLDVGVSVAEGARLPVSRAMAVAVVEGGLFVATERSVQRFVDGEDVPAAVVDDRPVVPPALTVVGDAVLYVADGAVRRWSP